MTDIISSLRSSKMPGRIWIILSVAIATIMLPLIYYIMKAPEDPLREAIIGLGYFPAIPPSNLSGPGAFYHVNIDGSIRSTVCGVSDKEVQPILQRSATTQYIADRLQQRGYSLGSRMIESINANLGMQEVSSISLKFTNVAVMEISSENLYEISQNKLAAGSHCDVEINNLLRARQFVCQGQSVLRASANYNVDVQSSGVTNASSEIDDEKINKVADVVNNELSGELPKLSISSESKAESASSERVLTTGDGLYYGTKLKYTCVTPDDSDRVWTLPQTHLELLTTMIWQRWPF
jgi:hypothetical protein